MTELGVLSAKADIKPGLARARVRVVEKAGKPPRFEAVRQPEKKNVAVDQFKGMKKQNGAEQTCAIFLRGIGLEMGFSTASTWS